jgi:hypothetical protein
MARRKTLKTFVSITSKSSATGEEKAVQEKVHMRMDFDIIQFGFPQTLLLYDIGNFVYC